MSTENPTPARRGGRLFRRVAAALLGITTVLVGLGVSSSPALASTTVAWNASCQPYPGSFGRTLTVYLNQQPVGTRIEADLYKYVASTGTWAYQKAYDTSTVNRGGYWQSPTGLVGNQLQLAGWSAGYYALYMYQWNARGVLLYQGWSNYCYFAS